jgi:pentapeptide repeat protein
MRSRPPKIRSNRRITAICYPSSVANPEHFAKLTEGIDAWNRWRKKNTVPLVELSGAYLIRANLIRANLQGADLRGAKLTGAKLDGAKLNGAKLSMADMQEASLSGANLHRANLLSTKLRNANLTNADLSRTNLRLADLSGADISHADLRSANLQRSNLKFAVLTGCKIWETQRAAWEIKEVFCERIYWDSEAKVPTEYAPGEFERLYSAQTCVELFYKNGISTFELSTLPALLQRLATKHPNANIRLRTIEETGGGAKITISLGDASPEVAEGIQADATEAHQLQLALRGREDELIDLRAALRATEHAYDKLLDKWSESRKQEITIHGNLQGPLQLGDHASADYRGAVFNDTAPLIQLLTELLAAQPGSTVAAAAQAAKAELQKPTPDKPALKRSLEFLKDLATEAVKKGAGKLGERAASTDWPALHHQITQFLHHLS